MDRLLARDADYAAHWLSFWNDLLRNAYKGTGFIDGGRKQITPWIIPALASNLPYDEMISQLIVPSPESEGFIQGIKWRGEVNASQTREIQFAQNVGQVFLGINMKCASCHDSFTDRWKLTDAYGLASIVAETPPRIHRCDKETGELARASWMFPELGSIDPDAPRETRLSQLADLLVHPDNGRTTRTLANRIWHRLMGRGLVHPVDAMDTEPWSEELLDHLANLFVESGYDLRALMAMIAKSRVYQMPSVPVADDAALVAANYRFTGPVARLLTAEQFVDCVEQLGRVPRFDERVYLLQPEADDLANRLRANAPVGTIPPETAVSYRTRFATPEATPLTLRAGIGRAGRVALNGNVIGRTGELLHATSRPGENVLLIDFGPEARRERGWLCFAVTPDRVILDGSEPWESRGGETSWEKMAPHAPDDRDSRNEAARHRAELTRSLIEARFGKPPRARASLRPNDLLMRSLGRPNREQVVSTRQEKLTMLQAMDLSNGADFAGLVREAAAGFDSPVDADAWIEDIFLRALCRAPSPSELRISRELVADGSERAREDFLWSIFLLPEFQINR